MDPQETDIDRVTGIQKDRTSLTITRIEIKNDKQDSRLPRVEKYKQDSIIDYQRPEKDRRG